MNFTPILKKIAAVALSPLAFLIRNKTGIITSSLITVTLLSAGVGAVKLRQSFSEQLAAALQATPTVLVSQISETPSDALLITTNADVLGSEPATSTPRPTLTPLRLPTLPPFPTTHPNPSPYPTFSPYPTSAPPLNCAGTANEDKSQVYLSPRTTQTGSHVTVKVELRDCKNTLNSDDWLNISLKSGDAQARINGQPFPQRIQAKSGTASFTVTSPVAGSITLIITDTNQNFPVTEPGYKNPTMTFTNAPTTPTFTPTSNPTITPTHTTSPQLSQTPTAGTTLSKTPTLTPTGTQ